MTKQQQIEKSRQQQAAKWQRIEKQTKDLKRFLKKCESAVRQIEFGFEPPIVNGFGQCSGCYNPDDGQLEEQCRGCPYNEYFVEGGAGAAQWGA